MSVCAALVFASPDISVNDRIQTEGIAVKDIMDEVRKSASPYLEMDGECRALTAIMSDDDLRAKAIRMLNARMKPYRNKDFPPEITTAWVTKIYLRAKGYPDERQRLIEEIRRDLIFGCLRTANFCH